MAVVTLVSDRLLNEKGKNRPNPIKMPEAWPPIHKVYVNLIDEDDGTIDVLKTRILTDPSDALKLIDDYSIVYSYNALRYTQPMLQAHFAREQDVFSQTRLATMEFKCLRELTKPLLKFSLDYKWPTLTETMERITTLDQEPLQALREQHQPDEPLWISWRCQALAQHVHRGSLRS